MVDSSWNGAGAAETRRKLPAWAKIGIGCGVAMVLLFATCMGGSFYLQHRFRKDPKGLERSVKGFAQNMVQRFIKDDWAFLRRTVEQLGTDEGARAFYTANPKLREQYATEPDFLAAVKEWRPKLEPIPEALPDLDSQVLNYEQLLGGSVVLGYRCSNGTRIHMTWDSKRIPNEARSHQLVEFTVR